ncbi:hypothetical protein I6J22_07685 [Corynebacterium kroppenstedtii]|uniref:hypothetical protein n=1 Tax=Corynebacterium TaxID=1716 RepID=UPI0011D12BB6|nr:MULTISPECIES: hypothetical protein [Corynebacterium]MDK7146818.1 hypothetical protein [Corynebacterium pseudokroppenstedtii]QRP10090.1 hypothetical protein I6J22_07685 [Corynebacterium kroppenstedtii]QRP14196.1 hypothetical protein I6J24_08940 [Corynebacterium kroppenstedtii]HJD69867.1 hypothetical protein [Corynebacterium kroppenstedtii]
MHWEKKLALSLDASMPVGSIPGASASASPASQEQRCVTAHRGSSTSTAERQTVSKDELAQLNKNIELVGGNPLSKRTFQYKAESVGKKVGPGLAISCSPDAGGALATYMGG